MKKIIIFMALVLSFLSCQKGEQMPLVASRFSLQLGESAGADGQVVTRKWEAGDKVGMLCMVDGKEERHSAPVLMEGRTEGMFMFNWSGYEQGRQMTFFFPEDAPVTLEDGKIKVQDHAVQDGSFKQLFIASGKSNGSSFMDVNMTLQPYWHIFSVSLAKDDHVVEKAEFRSAQHNVSVQFPTPLDCTAAIQKFYFSVPQAVLEEGYVIVFTTTDKSTFEIRSSEKAVLEAGKITQINDVKSPSEIVVCGDSMIYILDTDKARNGGFEAAVTWSWNGREVEQTIGGGLVDNLSDCKVVDNGTKVLATSSYSKAFLIDIATKELLWWSTSSKQAHSAELLPGGRIAVACSNSDDDQAKDNRIQIFDIDSPNNEISYVELPSAHGVVWNAATQRLYAVGGSLLNIYKLKNWDSDLPELELENSVDVSAYVTGLHDLTCVDDKTLLVAGKKAALYNIANGTFARLPHFNNSTALKSVNYDPVRGACWYTDATNPDNQASDTWSTNKIFYTSNVVGSDVELKIPVPEDFNMYKVRVRKW